MHFLRTSRWQEEEANILQGIYSDVMIENIPEYIESSSLAIQYYGMAGFTARSFILDAGLDER